MAMNRLALLRKQTQSATDDWQKQVAIFPGHVLIVLLLSLTNHDGYAQTPAGPASALPPVKVVQVEASTRELPVTLPARTAPSAEARIHSRATGLVVRRMVDLGDPVKIGEILAEIAAPEVDFQIAKAKATVAQAQAKARLAIADLERARALGPTRAIAKEDIDAREATASEAQANVLAAEAETRRLEEIRNFQTIRAPFDGTIAARQIDIGDHVRGDQASEERWLFHVVNLDPLRVDVDVPPDLAARVTAESKVEVSFRDFPGQVHEARVTRFSGVVDANSGTRRIELSLPNPKLSLPAGLSGNARFQLSNPPNAVLIPGNALLMQDGRPQVALVQENKVKFQPVTTGRNLGTKIEILSGLTPNDKVIINPNSLLRDGDTVTIAPETKPGK